MSNPNTAVASFQNAICDAPVDYAIGVDAIHRLVGEHARLANRRAEEGAFPLVADPAVAR
jgi:hypothetical protein